jgi:hypothetical protein
VSDRIPTPAHPALAVPPELLHHEQYEVLRELGRGGMGVVYLARNRLMKRPEVLKVINPQFSAEPQTAERFLREIEAAARLDHPNIVRAHAAFRAGALVVFVMEYVEGETLARLVETRGRLPVADAGRYARQAALALDHAHGQGLIHRDIKPANLILARSGLVKVLDFGLAKATSEGGSTSHGLTRSGEVFGTPSYLAPEQARDAAKADVRADLYSLGCTLYLLLAGRPPFQGRSLYELLRAHEEQEATPLDQVREDVPAGLAAVVAKMMAKDPAQRYQRPAEAARALEPFAEAGGQALSAAAPALGSVPAARLGGGPDVGAAAMANASTIRGRTATTRAPEKAPAWHAQPPTAPWSGRWLLVAGVAILVLAGAVGLWAGGVFRLRTPEGILVVEVNEPNPDVYVDGDKMTVTWGDGGKTALVRVRPGTHKVEVKKGGFTAFGDEVELRDGEHHVLTARLVSEAAPVPPGIRPDGPAKGRPERKQDRPGTKQGSPPPAPARGPGGSRAKAAAGAGAVLGGKGVGVAASLGSVPGPEGRGGAGPGRRGEDAFRSHPPGHFHHGLLGG